MARYITSMTVRVDAVDDEDARDLIDRAARLLIDSEWVDALVVAIVVAVAVSWHRTDDYDRRLYDHEHDWKSKW